MNNAVIAPITSTKLSAASESSNNGDILATMKIPAVTIVAACIKADIGVGPSIESGNHTCKGTWADLPTNEQEYADYRHDGPCMPADYFYSFILQAWRKLEYVCVVHGTCIHKHSCDTQQKAKVTYAIYQEGLEIGIDG